jgi:hypothetical protein
MHLNSLCPFLPEEVQLFHGALHGWLREDARLYILLGQRRNKKIICNSINDESLLDPAIFEPVTYSRSEWSGFMNRSWSSWRVWPIRATPCRIDNPLEQAAGNGVALRAS